MVRILRVVALGASLLATAIGPASGIAGGEFAKEGQFPYMVSLFKHTILGDNGYCGGVLISPNRMLTAAQCIMHVDSYHIRYRIGSLAHNYGGITARRYWINRTRERNGDPNDAYNQYTKRGNLALVQLRGFERWDNITQYAELPNIGGFPQPGQNVTVMGWGHTEKMRRKAYQLKYAELPVIDRGDCQKLIGPRLRIHEDKFCAGGGGKGTCHEDYGGPVMQGNTVVGIVSQGYGCGEKPSIFTSVSEHADWILARS